ncbi:hypothetical protein SBY92_000685 [Candida maltosa Xu316]
MQGQNRAITAPSNHHPSATAVQRSTASNRHSQTRNVKHTRDLKRQSSNSSDNDSDSLHTNDDDDDDDTSLDGASDINSDNVSTTPLKSIISTQSTKSPSILSGDAHNDQNSLIASTAETSLAPSVHTPTNYTFAPTITTTNTSTSNNNSQSLNFNSASASGAPDRDSESIVTLASSTRRIRRRSIDTNCSTAGIPPASIMERLSVQPGNSNYANSIRTANDRTSQIEGTSHYDDQGSSVKSFN